MTETAIRLTDNASLLDQGYVHIYTGDGKGKTTAAMGLALRAVGSGLKVAIILFMKNGAGGEFKAFEQFDGHIRVEHFGRGCFIHGEPGKKEIKHYYHKGVLARSGIEM
jgi:cob(I)alamin adenosyltransferase